MTYNMTGGRLGEGWQVLNKLAPPPDVRDIHNMGKKMIFLIFTYRCMFLKLEKPETDNFGRRQIK